MQKQTHPEHKLTEKSRGSNVRRPREGVPPPHSGGLVSSEKNLLYFQVKKCTVLCIFIGKNYFWPET